MNNPPDDEAWPPINPTDEKLEALTRVLEMEGEPDDFPDEAEDIPFADLDAEELPPESPAGGCRGHQHAQHSREIRATGMLGRDQGGLR